MWVVLIQGTYDSSGIYYLGISLAVILVAVFLKERLIGADQIEKMRISGYIILSDLEVWHTVYYDDNCNWHI